MLKLELIDLLNQYNKADKYEKEKIKESITNLMKQNKDKLEEFSQSVDLSQEQRELLEECYSNIKSEKFEKKQDSETDKIRNAYDKWLNLFQKNNRESNEQCKAIIEKIIEEYMPENIEVLEKVLEIGGDEDYEVFKTNLKNFMVAYYANEVAMYLRSGTYQKLNPLAKYWKQVKCYSLLQEIYKHKIDHERIRGVINGS